MSEFSGQVAWVAGGGRGIGRAIVERLARGGAAVVVGSRTLAEIEGTAREVVEAGGRARAIRLDVTRRESVEAFVEEAERVWGPPQILVYCAGINVRQPAEDYAEETWLRVLDVNLNGAFRFLQEAGRRLIAAGRGGSVVTITSMLAHYSTPNQSAYATSKGGLLMYTRLLAVEWARHGIRVNSVAPGYVETEMNAAARAQATFSDNVLAATPMKRYGRVEEIAEAVAWLASPAAGFVTGSEIVVDGGLLHTRPAIIARTT